MIADLWSLEGQTALVTGGGTGIGRMAVQGLVQAGAKVLIASRKQEACEATAKELNALGYSGQVEALTGDLSSQQGVETLASSIQNRTDRLEILVNNAGQAWGAPLDSFPYEAWHRILSVNVAGPFHLIQLLLPLLRDTATPDAPARIVNVGSVMGEIPMGDGAYSYAASKSALHHLTRILAKELAQDHITVNALAPGPFASNMTAFATQNAEGRKQVSQTVPLGRLGRSQDIWGALLFVCGGGGSYVTGAILPVSGGLNVTTGPALFAE